MIPISAGLLVCMQCLWKDQGKGEEGSGGEESRQTRHTEIDQPAPTCLARSGFGHIHKRSLITCDDVVMFALADFDHCCCYCGCLAGWSTNIIWCCSPSHTIWTTNNINTYTHTTAHAYLDYPAQPNSNPLSPLELSPYSPSASRSQGSRQGHKHNDPGRALKPYESSGSKSSRIDAVRCAVR